MTRAELKNLHRLSARIKATERRERMVRSRLDMLRAIKYKPALVQESARVGSEMEETIVEVEAEIDRLYAVIAEDMIASLKLLSDCLNLISGIDDQQAREVIERHCIDGDSFAKIARDTHYTKQGVYRIYDRTLKKFGL